MPHVALVILAVMLGLPGAALAQARGDAVEGQRLARQWCAACHQVEPSGPRNDTAPAFAVIAADARRRPEWLRAWLSTDHPNMPNLSLSAVEITNLTAHIASLAAR